MEIDIVVRASGIWDTRAPFHRFLEEHRASNRRYALASLALFELGERTRQDPRLPGRSIFSVSSETARHNRAWTMFKTSYPLAANGKRPAITSEMVQQEIGPLVRKMRSESVVGYVSLFEAYFHSWILNYLLACFEAGTARDSHRVAAALMSPLKRHNRRPRPGWPQLLERLPEVHREVATLPHVFNDPKTGDVVTSNSPGALKALPVLEFWRGFRNLVVHNDGVSTPGFVRRNGALFEQIREPYDDAMGPILPGRPLSLDADVFPSVCTVHYRAALMLNEKLEQMSGFRRGHPFAPDRKPKHFHLEGRHVPERLLVEGDHEKSLRFVQAHRLLDS